MQVGQLDPWRTNLRLESDRVREMAQLIELRGKAPEEVAARSTYLGLLGITAGQWVLDVGCGTGVVTRELARRVQPGGHVTAVDANPELLRIAQELAPHDHTIEFKTGDALALPIQPGTFDAVVCCTVLEHMPDAEQAIPELVRALKPGGRIGILCGDQESFIVSHPDRELTRRVISSFADARFAHPWIGRQVPRLLEAAGIDNVQVRGLSTVDRDPRHFAAQAARLRGEIAFQSGAISEGERDQWLQQLDAQGAFVAGATYLFSWGRRDSER